MADELHVAPIEELRRRRSAKWRTHPADVLPLTVAEMDFGLAESVSDALRQAIDLGDTGYAVPVPSLGEAFAGFAGVRWDWDVDAAQVTAITDVGVGVVETLRLVTRPGDTVVVSPPVYPPFFDWVQEAGTRLGEVPLRHTDDGWRLDLPALEHAFARRPAAYLLCNPHNPVGRVHDPDELTELIGLATRYGVTIVSDEIHAPLVLPGATFTPLLTVPGAPEVAVAVTSASKAFNLAGLKCAAIVTGSSGMAARIQALPPDTRWRTGQFGLLATVAAYRDGGAWLDRLLVTLDRRRAQLTDLLATRLPPIAWTPPQATYLAWLDCRSLGDADVAQRRFLERGRVALEPGPRFGNPGNGFARLNFATSSDVLADAVERMASALP